MKLALGLIETKGLVGAIEAADAMAKAAEVKILNKELVEGGLVLIKIVGEVAAVKASVDAGAAAAKKVGELLGTHVIPRPDLQLDEILEDHMPEKVDLIELSIPDDFESMTVQQLRQLARKYGDDFPIHGREISKANKETLVEAIKKIKK